MAKDSTDFYAFKSVESVAVAIFLVGVQEFIQQIALIFPAQCDEADGAKPNAEQNQ